MLNKEIKIAIGVGIIMIVICLIVVLSQKSNKPENVDVKIYKLYNVEGTEDKHYYKACSLSTEDALKINKEYKRAMALKDTSALTSGSINGDYKVIIDDEYLAFDNDNDNIIYNGTKNKLYSFSSEMYNLVIKSCTIKQEGN